MICITRKTVGDTIKYQFITLLYNFIIIHRFASVRRVYTDYKKLIRNCDNCVHAVSRWLLINNETIVPQSLRNSLVSVSSGGYGASSNRIAAGLPDVQLGGRVVSTRSGTMP